MKLLNIVVKEAIIPKLVAVKRDDSIGELLDALVKAGRVPAAKRDEFVKAVIKREKRGSTGIGHGVAVPHVKSLETDSVRVAVGLSERGVEFNALDRQPVHAIFLLVSPEERPEEHIAAMEAIVGCLGKDQFRRFLRQARSVDDVVTLLEEADAGRAVH
ncbi:MAG: PTS sugar transporter subunit IIA [Phycisphaeraceae bacterium]|nr:PTS sugar transporter subunit IIA [Phycisphaeraceae bacterium]